MIEIDPLFALKMSRSTWACELKYIFFCKRRNINMSRSTWACELKFAVGSSPVTSTSHAPRERVSWNRRHGKRTRKTWGHAPRERVSWNVCWPKNCLICTVTLHVSVWVEILTHWRKPPRLQSHAPRERVSWNLAAFKTLCGILVTLHVSVWVEMFVGLKIV